MSRRAKIVCTIGPASESPELLERLVAEGMDVARLNFSHGTHAEHARNIAAVRSISQRLGHPVAVLQDLAGIKLRIGDRRRFQRIRRRRPVGIEGTQPRDFGVELPRKTEIRVFDSTAETRYLVLPQRPSGTEGWSEEKLAMLVTRDCMIGTGLAKRPEEIA